MNATNEASVPFWTPTRMLKAREGELHEAMAWVLESGRLILGPEVAEFEREFGALTGLPHVVGLATGTDALVLALKALGVGARTNDEVIVPSFIPVPTVSAVVTAGARPVFADVEAVSRALDPVAVEAALTPETRAIVVVHAGGTMGDVAGLRALADERGVALIEDCAQATGATLNGAAAGSFGTIAAYSFYPTKILGALGDGGAVATHDEALARRVRRLRFYGTDEGHGPAKSHGTNSRLDALQAAFLRVQLRHVGDDVAERRAIAGRYAARLAGCGAVELPGDLPGVEPVYYTYTVMAERRDALAAHLAAHGVATKANYDYPVHRMPAYAAFAPREGALRVTDALAGRALSLPVFVGMTEAEQARVCDAVEAFSG